MRNFLDKILRAPEDETGTPVPEPTPTGEPAPVVDPALGDPALNPLAAAPAPKPEEKVEDKTGEPAPVTFDAGKVVLPEGINATPEDLAALSTVLLDDKLSPEERASALLTAYKTRADADAAAAFASYTALQTQRQEALKADPTFGGANYETNLTVVATAINQFSPNPEEFRKELTQFGMGNSVHLANFLLAVGKATAEGKPVVGAPTSETPASPASMLYPNQGKG